MVAILDYDAGNLKSVKKALEWLGEEAVITRDFHTVQQADRVILPGVGSFGTAMDQIKKYELHKVISEVIRAGVPFLGICLGLQLLFEGSEECDGVEGLGILRGGIVRLPKESGLKIPHIGWNSLTLQNNGRLFAGLEGQPGLTNWYFWISPLRATPGPRLLIWCAEWRKKYLSPLRWAEESVPQRISE